MGPNPRLWPKSAMTPAAAPRLALRTFLANLSSSNWNKTYGIRFNNSGGSTSQGRDGRPTTSSVVGEYRYVSASIRCAWRSHVCTHTAPASPQIRATTLSRVTASSPRRLPVRKQRGDGHEYRVGGHTGKNTRSKGR